MAYQKNRQAENGLKWLKFWKSTEHIFNRMTTECPLCRSAKIANQKILVDKEGEKKQECTAKTLNYLGGLDG